MGERLSCLLLHPPYQVYHGVLQRPWHVPLDSSQNIAGRDFPRVAQSPIPVLYPWFFGLVDNPCISAPLCGICGSDTEYLHSQLSAYEMFPSIV